MCTLNLLFLSTMYIQNLFGHPLEGVLAKLAEMERRKRNEKHSNFKGRSVNILNFRGRYNIIDSLPIGPSF